VGAGVPPPLLPPPVEPPPELPEPLEPEPLVEPLDADAPPSPFAEDEDDDPASEPDVGLLELEQPPKNTAQDAAMTQGILVMRSYAMGLKRRSTYRARPFPAWKRPFRREHDRFSR
jgi:hypothetical protein